MSASLAPQLAVPPKVYREGSSGLVEVLGSRRGETDILGEWGVSQLCRCSANLSYKMLQFRLKLGWRNSHRKMAVGCRERDEAYTVVRSRCLVLQRGLQTQWGLETGERLSQGGWVFLKILGFFF